MFQTDIFVDQTDNTKCNFNSVQSHSGIMPMNRNVMTNRVSEDWPVTFLQSVLFEVGGLGKKNPTHKWIGFKWFILCF